LLGDSQSLTITGIIGSLLICGPHKVQKIRKQTMSLPENLKHTKWECKYHLAWIPKYRKKSLYEFRQYLGSIAWIYAGPKKELHGSEFLSKRALRFISGQGWENCAQLHQASRRRG